MGKLYNRPFKVGFIVTVVLVALLNVVSFLIAYDEYLRRATTNGLSRIDGSFNWGFPFAWFGYSSYFFEDGFLGLVLNFGFAIGCAFAVGLLVRLGVQKFSERPLR
jgi:hypothetical protein